ncbi:hypothetical protein GDO86_003891 [Hymenochirus boettgeri]|uniref:C2H2-type domain-containing protein n=1 Tax=Hymenochirus boettgeri TaxID=247094 RepID=A0A8T2K7R3_9PIPI|nr:hypothetical protein GDO86_003891 [Hymenochirus boettgeri]
MEATKKLKVQSLVCDRCNFHGSDYETVQIHMGTIHPEFCDELDTAGLGRLVFYQKSAKLFHCHRCFFTSKMFSNVYYHILARHSAPDKWNNGAKPIIDLKSSTLSAVNADKKSENGTSGDKKSVYKHEQKDKLSENEKKKTDESDTLSSWPEKLPKQESRESSDSDFRSSIVRKTEQSSETKERDSSSDQDLESESNSSSCKLGKSNCIPAKQSTEFSDNEPSLHSKDIPEFSDDEETPALPDGLPHFSEDEESTTHPKNLEEFSEGEVCDQAGGIEDISEEEEEIPAEKKIIEDVSEDEELPAQPKDEVESSEEDEVTAPVNEMMEFSEEEDEAPPAVPKHIMEFSEEEEEQSSISKNIMEFSEEEEESTIAAENLMVFPEEGTLALSKDIMKFSEVDDTRAVPKSIMEFSEEEDSLSETKDMPKYLEGSSTPTQLKNTEDADSSKIKEFSEDEETQVDSKDITSNVLNLSTPTRLAEGLTFLEDEGNSSLSKDLLEASDAGGISAAALDISDAPDDKDGFFKDEEIMKHVRRVKGKFYCLLCESRPLKKGPALHHLITKHNLPSPFICKMCGKIFVMETPLKHHLASHYKGLFKCLRCSFQTDHPRGFKKHQTHCQRGHKEEFDQPGVEFQVQSTEEN